MDLRIRPVTSNDVEDVVQLSLLAWVPVFESFERILGSTIYKLIWPDWKAGQREAIENGANLHGTPDSTVDLAGAVTGDPQYCCPRSNKQRQ